MAIPGTVSATSPPCPPLRQPWKKWFQPGVSKPRSDVVERAMETYDDSQNGKGPVGIQATVVNLE
jgi:hypothetical protein